MPGSKSNAGYLLSYKNHKYILLLVKIVLIALFSQATGYVPVDNCLENSRDSCTSV
jgi:hypothetical protein